MKQRANQLLEFLFVESQEKARIDEVDGVKGITGDGNAAELTDERAEVLKTRKTELEKILKDLGISEVADRLSTEGDAFKLLANDAELHKADADILFDLTKITPLVDANFAAINGETELDGSGYILIIPLSQNGEGLGDGTNYDFDSDLKSAVEDGKVEHQDTDDFARNLVEKLLK
jgi:hypothetical protein